MKNNRLKKAVLALSLAATMAIPAAASFATPVTASAATPFISDTDYNGAINIDESQINVTCKKYYPGGNGISTSVSGTTVKTAKTVTNIPVLTRSIISLWVSGNGLTKAKAENVQLTVTYHINGKKNTQVYKNPSVRTGTGSNAFVLDFNIETHGDSFEFTTSSFSGVSNLKCTSSSISPQGGSSSYYQIEAKTPGGENIFISSKYPGHYSTNMEKWAKKLCMYANSLSDVTGVKLGTVYINFDEPYADTYAWAYSGNWRMNDKKDELGYVALSTAASAVEIDFAAEQPDVMTWTLMHEMAHSYAINCTPSTFDAKYDFNDEYLTNVRGLTAIQNCDNLRGLDVNFAEHYAKYDEIFEEINPAVSDPCFYHARKLVKLGKTYGWDKLEAYFKADSAESYTSDANYAYANALKTYLGKSFSTNNGTYLKYVNSLRKLMELCWGYCNEQSFTSFVEQNFGKQCVISTLTDLKVIK